MPCSLTGQGQDSGSESDAMWPSDSAAILEDAGRGGSAVTQAVTVTVPGRPTGPGGGPVQPEDAKAEKKMPRHQL